MESKLVEFYELANGDRQEFLINLSNEELAVLMNDTTSCFKTLDDLSVSYAAFNIEKEKGSRPFIGIWWLIKKEAKKAWEESCCAAEAEIIKKEKAIRGSYIQTLLDREMSAIIAQYPSSKKEDMLTRSSATTFLKIKLKNDFMPVILAEANSRQ